MPDHRIEFKSTPYPHQEAEFDLSRSMEARSLWWEPGCGKTMPTIVTAADMFDAGAATGMLVLAPGGVHEQWIKDQMPVHMRDDIRERTATFAWSSKKSKNKSTMNAFESFRKSGDFRVLTMTYSAIMTDRGAKAARQFMKDDDVLFVLDESHNIKTPGAKRTKRIHAAGKHAVSRRVLTGTPVDDKPFDVYSQLKWVNPNVWKELGIGTFAAFKATFGVFEKRRTRDNREFPELICYRNLDKLKELLLREGSRLRLQDVWDDMPEELYEKVYFDLSPGQRRLYEEIGNDFMTHLDDGSLVTAALAITRQIRQQQICSGYLPADDEDLLRPIDPKSNPKLTAFRDTMDRLPGQVVCWGKYNIDIDCMAAACEQDGYSYVSYDGRTSEDDRREAVTRFRDGDVKVFIGKPSAAGTGTDGLQRAANVAVWYNNGFRLNHRLQGQGRLLRFGQDEGSVLNIDIVGRETIEELILQALRQKRCLASEVQGDEVPDWV